MQLEAPLGAPLEVPLGAPLEAPLEAPSGAPLGAPLGSPASLDCVAAVSREGLPPPEVTPEVQCEQAIHPSNALGRRQLDRSRLVV